ncbi:ABC transporter ATP-binding protein [Roseibium aquae]|uniref:ABC transporter ATP-binding protein n=1 Tax=Roseibium aquae TaxID=1323746 RepID=A0A916X3D7_9HYPH|nr:ATP-binding cassette domain-containing protein [Roseibium aquae]GGB57701.1 ABC transporter ATP-binding protein [Roseibium aquae]
MTTAKAEGLTLRDVTITLKGKRLLRMDLTVPPGAVLTVMGESGRGKSTFLDFIAGFLKPPFAATGEILLNGRDITHLTPQERRVGLMFQTPLLFPHLSVMGNLLFALPETIRKKRDRIVAAEQALAEAGLAGYAARDPATLSGGQQTRVALMRVLLSEPQALLLDEPFSSLDRARRADIRSLVFETARKRALPVILVTHDEEDAHAAGGLITHL